MMDYILLIIGFISVALAWHRRRAAFFTPPKLNTSTLVKVEEPNEPVVEVERDSMYYFRPTTVVLRIQNTLFRVHEDFLSSEPNVLWKRISESRRSQECMDGSSDARAIVFDHIPVEELRALLEYFYYKRTRELTREREIEYLHELLAASSRTQMSKVFEYDSKKIINLQPPLPPHRRIFLYQQYPLTPSVWLYPAIAELIEQVEPLNMDEAQQVGLGLLEKIAAMREAMRPSRNEDGTSSFTQAELTRYASSYLQRGPRYTSVVPLPVHRRIAA